MFLQGVFLFILVVAVAGTVRGADNATEVRQDRCSRGRCLAELLNGLRGSFQIVPGVNISSSSAVAVRSASASDALFSYLKSLTLHVALYNEPILSFFGGIEKDSTGRAKRPHTSSKFKFLSVYTVFAVGFALLSALVGKAVTLSVIALVITAIAATRGFGFGFGTNANNSPPIYDIIRRPHIQVQHTHSAEEVYEAPGTSGGGVSYVYPVRGRAVPVSDSYLPQTVHVTSQSDTQAERHVHIS